MTQKICYVSSKEPFEYTIHLFSGKWKLRILYVLACMGTVRYSMLKQCVDGITHKMLGSQLNELEQDGIVDRTEYPQIPPKVEYALSEKGQSLIPLIAAMCDWGKEHQT